MKPISSFFFLLMLFLFLTPHGLLAVDGGKVGNGGDVRVCRNDQGKITEIELYDYYEARTKRKNLGLDIALGDDDLSVLEKAAMAFDRLGKYLPGHAAQFKLRAAQILDESTGIAVFLEGIRLDDIPDTDSRYWPRNCFVEQIAIRETPEISTDPHFTIDKDLWQAFELQPVGKDQQAGLIIHEVLYESFAKLGETDSSLVRFLNSYIVSSKFEQLSPLEGLALINQLPINREPNFRIFGIEFVSATNLKILPDGSIKGSPYFAPGVNQVKEQFVVVNGTSYSINPGYCFAKYEMINNQYTRVKTCNGAPEVEFYANFAVKRFTPRTIVSFKVGDKIIQTKSEVSFYDNGAIKSIIPIETSLLWDIREEKIHLRVANGLSFYQNGALKDALLDGSQAITVHRKKVYFQGYGPEYEKSLIRASNFRTSFHPNGIPSQGYLTLPSMIWSEKQKQWLSIYSNGTLVNRVGELREYTRVNLKESGFLESAVHSPLNGTPTHWE